MPLPKGTRYRVTTKGGKNIRLSFGPSNRVIEAKNLKTGATHTPEEFEADREKRHPKANRKKYKRLARMI